MDLNDRWLLFKAQIQKELEPEEYEGWLDHVELVEVSAKKIIIAEIPHPLFRDDIARNHDQLFRRLFTEIFPDSAPFHKKQIKYYVGTYHAEQKKSIQTEFAFEETGTDSSLREDPSRDDLSHASRNNLTSLSHSSQKIIALQPSMPSEEIPPLFDPKQTLDALVVGNHNRLAYEAACRIIHAPGVLYNPFYIYGQCGLGKTHLLEAIGQAFHTLNPEYNVIYLTAESFLNDFVTHIQHRKMSAFRQRYRHPDVLLIDNIQTLAGTKNCQEEMWHTIETLQKTGKQIAVTSYQLPRHIKNLDQALCSQLESGLMVDIKNPDLETRMALLQSRARRDRVILPPEVGYFIAQHIFSNVRKMESALIRLSAHASLLRQKITLDFAKTTLADLIETPLPASPISFDHVPSHQIEKVFQKICTLSQVSQSDLKSGVRANRIVRARQMSMYLLNELTDMSLKEIGAQFGNRTHSTIHNSLKQLKKKMENDDVLRQQLQLLKEDLIREAEANQLKMPQLFSELK